MNVKGKTWMCAGVLGVASLALAEPQVVQVWPEGKVPLKTSDEPEKVNPSKDDIVRITNVNEPTLTVFPAKDAGKPNPAVMVCPGGGYGILAWNHEGTEMAEWLNGQGISAFVLKYRVPGNQRDAALCDAQRALGLIRSQAKAFNIDPARLGIMGFSAGGHLSARTSTNFGKRFYEPFDEIDAHSCRPDFSLIIYPAYLFQKGGLDLAPEITVTKDTPPAFILQAEDDKPYVDSSLAYFIALKAAGVPAELHLFPDGGHGYGLRKRGKSTDAWGGLAEVWLSRVAK
jgi:acetyl esterase/lipase